MDSGILMDSGTGDLSQFVQEQCRNLGLNFTPEEPKEILSEKERRATVEATFPADLFTMPVDLSSSKKAFVTIVSGLSEDIPSFDEVWRLKQCDPKADYNPMGHIDVSCLTATGQ
jgi:hypothetical protein